MEETNRRKESEKINIEKKKQRNLHKFKNKSNKRFLDIGKQMNVEKEHRLCVEM